MDKGVNVCSARDTNGNGEGEDEDEDGEAGETMVVDAACDTGESGDAESGGKGAGDSEWVLPSSAWSTALYLTAMVVGAARERRPDSGGFSTAWIHVDNGSFFSSNRNR